METQSGGLMQKQNLNSHCRGDSVIKSTNVYKKKTVSVGSRRALADLSNSANPSTCLPSKNHSFKLGAVDAEHSVCKPTYISGGKINVHSEFPNSGKPSMPQASKKKHLNKLRTNKEETNVSKPRSPVKGEINVLNPTTCQGLKNHQFNVQGKVNGRKALANISNRESLSVHQASKINHSKKLSSVADEQFLHDHKGCVKSRTRAADMEDFMRTLGLDDDSSMQLSFESELLEQRRGKVESPLRNWETMEIVELPKEIQTPFQHRTLELLDINRTSQQCRTFKSPKFALMDTPKLSSVLNPLDFE
ncbi:hypothetical protein I3760_12G088400 [Carya illinoinensis]|uniref:Uncharacterized protein n=1 Tax=Carya illinoinensis TaxID=32201 RepID=A0A922DII0_CARIL|nr:hypothetical protein I3760_12G088400 [Carya illinoinensis]KAG2677209.1 hypothetical protein I3760_12G088400 [Carya illinoinensis]KAG2677210.1 hypothetical protein I3760_12G088400 [Carya illinoinensis]KAG6684961.1 hypothetical protein I3842_12G089800 [Carya illinoinensis]KAG6684962.1 hypothetical protein I3842_12G089800 [Carya illinoinensis]